MRNKPLISLLKRPSFTAREASEVGITSSHLAYYVNKGILERASRGVFRNPKIESTAPFEWQDLLETAQSIPDGTICLVSALSYYNLTLEIQREFWIAVPHESKGNKRPNTRIIRMRNSTLGRLPLKVAEFKTYIYDKERSVVDAFRHLSRESALYTLKEYLKRTDTHRPNLPKLSTYAKKLRVNLTPYIEALI